MARKKLSRASINTVTMSFFVCYETWLWEILDIRWEKNLEAVASRADSVVYAPFLCSSVCSDTIHL